MKIAHIMRSPAAAGALTAKVCATASVPDEKTDISQGNILMSNEQMRDASIECRSLAQKKYFIFRPVFITFGKT